MKKPLPKPALTPDKENREAPVLVLPPNPKTPTPEAEVVYSQLYGVVRNDRVTEPDTKCIFLQTMSYDEGCDTVTHSHVRLLEQVRDIIV